MNDEDQDIEIEIISEHQDMAAAFQIRRDVFRIEQGVSEAEEFDGLDGEATHYLIRLKKMPIGTARSRLIARGVAKIERVAVIASLRDQGFGRELMKFVMDDLATDGISEITINAQLQVIPFYRSLKFVEVGDEFLEADIRHKKMNFQVASQNEPG